MAEKMDESLLPLTEAELVRRWGIPENSIVIGENPRQRLLALLQARLLDLLQHDFEFLVNAMYRLDVPEPLFHQAMGHQIPEKIAPILAEIVLEREIFRQKIRKKYSKKG